MDQTAARRDAAPAPAAADTFAFGSARYAWLVTVILCGLQIASNMERQILSLVIEPLRHDFHIRDVQVSILQGIAFALLYALAAIPIGWVADRWRRDRIIMIGLGLWAVSTLGCLVAKSFSQLFWARLLIGLADASLVPASLSLLSDYFPRSRLASPVGAITGASFLGSGAALTFGGLLLGVLPTQRDFDLPLIGVVHGWQIPFGAMCVIGLLLSVALQAVREPPRRTSGQPSSPEARAGAAEVVGYLFSHRGYLGSLLGGVTLLSAYQYGVTTWAVTLFIRAHGWSATRIGLIYGLYFMVIGAGASVIGGRLCDHLRRRGRRDANFLIPLVSVCLLIPLGVTFALSRSAPVGVTLLGVITFFSVVSFGPATAAIPDYVPNRLRAQVIALTMLLNTLVGAGGGPWLVAVFTDDVFGNAKALPYSMAACAPLLLIPALICFAVGAAVARRQIPPAAA